ncbi:hypothetical protein Dsin_022989 [Dipteronia sinensis]|uniref:Phytocyanin domain-containing protein n=1 Tax=Dipteronia sinensis TaxID=43782 RepID=A0AAE0A3J4_9ROSI|nr:hypothetical protein Dsin_022989 [Dipteronia sinensis]
MGRIMSMAQLVMALALVASLLQGTAANVFKVLWGSRNFYTNVASPKTVKLGDRVEFDFVQKAYEVVEVSADVFDTYDPGQTIVDTIINTYTNVPANVTFNTPGDRYFICIKPEDCNKEKLKITVADYRTTPPTTTTTSPRPPQLSSSSPRGVAFAFVFLSLAIAF